MIPVILCGGSGSRLWPLSRTQYPKQYLNLLDDELSLFQQTVIRLKDHDCLHNLICLTNEKHRFIVAHQLAEINVQARIILEPAARNTAAAIATVCEFVLRHEAMGKQLLVLPSDHYIADTSALHQAIERVDMAAKQGHIVTFGIQPTHAETGYGYIRCTSEAPDPVLAISEFVEKPNLETAKSYLQQGNYFWNAGIFMFNAKVMKSELMAYAPEVVKQVGEAIDGGTQDLDFFRLGEAFHQAEDISIDYAVMEHTDKGVLVVLEAGWSDVGSFQAMMDFHVADEDHNVLLGEVIALDSVHNFVYSKNRLVSLLGLDNMVVIDTGDCVLITTKNHTQEVGKVMTYLKHHDNEKAHFQPQIHRPWGWYETLIESQTFKVKRIHVYPQGKLSLQKHRHRAEHWVVVSGIATVTCGEKTFQLHKNQSTFIPLGSVHRLANEQTEDLQIIEVQNGTYLGEDDIVRLEDIYQRS